MENERVIILENCIEQYKYSMSKRGYDVKYSCLTQDSAKPQSYTLLLVFNKNEQPSDFWANEFLHFKQGVYAQY